MFDPVDNYQALFGALMSDVNDALRVLTESDTQFNRRTYVRAVFALIEGETHLRKQYALMLYGLHTLKLSESEVALLREEQYRLDNKGEADVQRLFLRLPENVKFSFKMEAKAFNAQYRLETQGNGWESFLKAIEVRHRITHPKQFDDFEISDDDLVNIEKTLEWYKRSTASSSLKAPRLREPENPSDE